MTARTGQCLCGSVRYEICGEPLHIGLCHCADCRKESGSVFTAFAVWPRAAFSSTGAVSTYAGRSFCPACGSRLFNLTDEQAEIRLGSLDEAPSSLAPAFEIWTKRREPWLPDLPLDGHYREDRSTRLD